MAKTHIVLQGFGTFPTVFKALILEARAQKLDIEWSIVCTTGHFVKEFEDLLGKDAVLYLNKDMATHLKRPDVLEGLSSYHGSIYWTIETEKRTTKHKKSMDQVRSAAALYHSIKAFLKRRKPTHALFAQMEGMDALTLLATSKELGLKTLVPVHTRYLGETFYSDSSMFTLPPQAKALPKYREKAETFLKNYRSGKSQTIHIPENVKNCQEPPYTYTHYSLLQRCLRKLKFLADEPELRQWETLRASFIINFRPYTNQVLKLRRWTNANTYDLDSLEQLPKRFAYYPLQLTPEASINATAPYYVNQLRAIDRIRLSLPSDMFLVVKEHPIAMYSRRPKFLKALQKKAGVQIIKYDVSSKELVERADITVTVTGTAALEAYLVNKPSLTLGDSFFSDFLPGYAPGQPLEQQIATAINNPPADEDIIKMVQKIYSVTSPFVMGSPTDKGSVISPHVLKKSNIRMMLDHLRKNL